MRFLVFFYTTMIRSPEISTENQIGALVYEPNFVWAKQNITLAFVNGDQKEQLEFRRIYFEWFKCTHLHFIEVELNRGGDIRVGFRLDTTHSWSLIGSLSADYSVNLSSGKVYRDYRKTSDPSMVIASLSRRKVLHEGGHSLSAKHEHAHALANISWEQSFSNGSMFPHLSVDFIPSNYLQKLPLNQSLGPFDE
jgi:hypothetical protein